MGLVAALMFGVLPTKYEAVLAQLEAEPAGVGLDANATYESLEDAASSVMRAMERVLARSYFDPKLTVHHLE